MVIDLRRIEAALRRRTDAFRDEMERSQELPGFWPVAMAMQVCARRMEIEIAAFERLARAA
jgi:phytoene/squalene synthetase